VRIFATEKDWCDADDELAGDLIYSSFQWLKSAGRMAPLTVVSMESPAVLMGDFDLSPLQKFMGRPRKWFVSFFGVSPKMYGMDYDFDWVPPAPSPEKSPQEKALEDFIAKRKAKREVVKPAGNVIGNGPGVPDPTYHKDMWHLDRAMRRLSFHEQDIHTRLMPYRREE